MYRANTRPPVPLALPFPTAGPRLANQYRELEMAASGDEAVLEALGDLSSLPRPWEPGTVQSPTLRKDLFAWLDHVVTWFNSEYVWESNTMIPACWPLHPHLVHEIAVLADQRRKAGEAFTSDLFEEWHRYSVPYFLDRMKARMRGVCDEKHQPWPGKGRYARHVDWAEKRQESFALDIESMQGPETTTPAAPRLTLVDGNLLDEKSGEVYE
ncbi:hypothetical protein K0651_13080 [Ornithinimicrobium sp. Arc0846-15]|nr:hypothetical protein [Ornithinimicrobium laminariae]